MTTKDNIEAATKEARRLAATSPADALRGFLTKNSDSVPYTLVWNAESLLVDAHKREFAMELGRALDSTKMPTVESVVSGIISEWVNMLVKVCLRAAASTSQSTSPMANLNESMRAKAAAILIDASPFRPFSTVTRLLGEEP